MQVGGQFFAQPRALKMAGGLIFLFALIPGFPKPQLFTLAFAAGGLGYVLDKMRSAPEPKDSRQELNQALKPTVKAARKGRRRPPGRLCPHRAHSSSTFRRACPKRCAMTRSTTSSLPCAMPSTSTLGVPFPGINLRVAPTLAGLSYELQLNEIPMSRGQLEPGMVLAREDENTLRMLGVEVKKDDAFLPDVESLWVPEASAAQLQQAGMAFMSHSRILAYHLSLVLVRHASSFIGLQETKYLLDRMEERAPDLVREATRLLPIQRIAEIFQRLAQEQISIRDLHAALDCGAPRKRTPSCSPSMCAAP